MVDYDIEFEIEKRKELLARAACEKLTKEERQWLLTHSSYNRWLGASAYNTVVEHLSPKTWYDLEIKVESVSYDRPILPAIYASASKGKIIYEQGYTNIDGEPVSKDYVRMLGFRLNDGQNTFKVSYLSDLGLLSVFYECEYFDEKMRVLISKSSYSGDPRYAIKRQMIDDGYIRYHCKNPLSDDFEAMVFTVRWQEKKPESGKKA